MLHFGSRVSYVLVHTFLGKMSLTAAAADGTLETIVTSINCVYEYTGVFVERRGNMDPADTMTDG
jgi:hypothetical protein